MIKLKIYRNASLSLDLKFLAKGMFQFPLSACAFPF